MRNFGQYGAGWFDDFFEEFNQDVQVAQNCRDHVTGQTISCDELARRLRAAGIDAPIPSETYATHADQPSGPAHQRALEFVTELATGETPSEQRERRDNGKDEPPEWHAWLRYGLIGSGAALLGYGLWRRYGD